MAKAERKQKKRCSGNSQNILNQRVKMYASWLYERVIEFLNCREIIIIVPEEGAALYDGGSAVLNNDIEIENEFEEKHIQILTSELSVSEYKPETIVLYEIFHEFFDGAPEDDLFFIINHLLEDLEEEKINTLKNYIQIINLNSCEGAALS